MPARRPYPCAPTAGVRKAPMDEIATTRDRADAYQLRHDSALLFPCQASSHRAVIARARQAHAPITWTAPRLCRPSGPIASSGRHHTPNGTPEKSIEPRRITAPPAFSPTEFLWRLRAPKTLTSFAAGRRGLKWNANPYPVGTDASRSWQSGLLEGQTKPLESVDDQG